MTATKSSTLEFRLVIRPANAAFPRSPFRGNSRVAPKNLSFYANVICRLRSEINLLLVEEVSHREMSNALYYDRLCSKREKELTDPDDVLFDAEQRKKEIEEEQRQREEDQDQKSGGPVNPV